MSKLKIIVGTTRPTRAADKVAPWVASVAAAHERFGARYWTCGTGRCRSSPSTSAPSATSTTRRTPNTVVIPFVNDAFDDAGRPASPLTSAGLDVALDDLAGWSAALEQARAAGELPPGRSMVQPKSSRVTTCRSTAASRSPGPAGLRVTSERAEDAVTGRAHLPLPLGWVPRRAGPRSPVRVPPHPSGIHTAEREVVGFPGRGWIGRCRMYSTHALDVVRGVTHRRCADELGFE